MANKRSLGVMIVALALTLVAGACLSRRAARHRVVRQALMTSTSPEAELPRLPGSGGWPYAQRAPHDWGLDSKHGITLEFVPRVTGNGTLSALVNDNADIASSPTAPIIRGIASGDPLLILARTDRSRRQVHLVVAADHVDDWMDRPIGYVRGTVLENALFAELRARGQEDRYHNGELLLSSTQAPITLVSSLLEGTTSSALMFSPQAAALTYDASPSAGPPGFVDITTPDMYEFSGFVVTTTRRWDENRDGILRAMLAFKDSRNAVAADPQRRLRDIQRFEAGDTAIAGSTATFWSAEEIVFDTDRNAIEASLKREAQLMVETGQIDAVPSFDDALSVVDDVHEFE